MSTVFIAVDSGGTRTNVEVRLTESDFETRRFDVPHSVSGVVPHNEYPNVMRRIFAPIENYWHEHDVQGMRVGDIADQMQISLAHRPVVVRY